MSPRTLAIQNQIRSTTSGIEYDDTMTLALAETIVNTDFLTDPTQVSGTLIMDLNFLRTAIRDIKGETPLYNWFDPVVTTPGLITLSGARSALTNIQTFIGADNDLDTTPDYTSTVFVSQNSSLETAISALDAALATVSGNAAGAVTKRILVRTGGNFAANTSLNTSTPGAGWSAYGDAISWATANDFVENVSIFYNGQLQLTASGAADNNDVYQLGSPSIAFEFVVRANDVIQLWRTPGSV